MKKNIIAGLIFSSVLIASSVSAESPKEALNLQDAFVKVSKDVGQAVVSISTEHTERYQTRYYPFAQFQDQFFNEFFVEGPERELKKIGLGSGLIINKEGYIITNEHVVHGADKITVTLPDAREFDARLTGSDIYSDLAVIKIEPIGELPFARLGNSDDIQIGYWAIAIGNPFAFAVKSPEPTVTVGVISALHRNLPMTDKRAREYSDLIQTDAAINPGNSGGPLVNIYGDVIGINVAIFTLSGGSEGMGFAIPINAAKKIIDDLMQGKKILYGWLGVIIQDIDADLASYFGLKDNSGVLVSRIVNASPAEKAGLKPGDIVISLDNEKIKNTEGLVRTVLKKDIGEKVALGIVRNKKLYSAVVEIGERPEDKTTLVEQKKPEPAQEVQKIVKSWRGIEASDITSDIAQRFKIVAESGVIVLSVQPQSLAEQAGIRPGDVIYEIDRVPVKNMRDYSVAAGRVSGDALIGTYRGYVVLKEK
ncbi:MAG: trypsin-like peptidase domain-containing protein [Candidatus Omnitrophota bacterium]|nr:trypsin-like peptidase domain-containing protein [Candidatus Omnitrophota bacterium]